MGGDRVKILKETALQFYCELKRIRRSRNWQLQGNVDNLEQFAQQLKGRDVVQDSPFFVEKVLDSVRPHLQDSLPVHLAQLVANNPAITLAELMEKTGCTIVQARLARDEEEL